MKNYTQIVKEKEQYIENILELLYSKDKESILLAIELMEGTLCYPSFRELMVRAHQRGELRGFFYVTINRKNKMVLHTALPPFETEYFFYVGVRYGNTIIQRNIEITEEGYRNLFETALSKLRKAAEVYEP